MRAFLRATWQEWRTFWREADRGWRLIVALLLLAAVLTMGRVVLVLVLLGS